MTRLAFRIAQAQVLNNKEVKRGIDSFEKYIGRIGWLHPENNLSEVKSKKKYAVINQKGQVVFESDKLNEIAKEFCTYQSKISKYMNSGELLNGKYMILRCENE